MTSARRLTAGLVAIALGGSAHAISSGAGTSAGQFLQIGQGAARASALGGAYVALAEGSEAMTWNPAGLALAQQRELGFSYLRYIQNFTSPIYMAYAHPTGRVTWGANFGYVSDDGFDVRDANGVPLQNTNVNYRAGFGAIGLARSFWYERLFLGGTIRETSETIAGSQNTALMADLGAIAKPNNTVSLGFSLQNLGTNETNAPRIMRLGGALRVNDFMTTAVELSNASDAGTQVGIGGEFQLPEEYLDIGQLTLRIGYRTVDSYGQSFDGTLKTLKLDQSSGLSFGLGIYTSQAFGYGISLDYAFIPMGALGTADQIAAKVKF